MTRAVFERRQRFQLRDFLGTVLRGAGAIAHFGFAQSGFVEWVDPVDE